MVGNVQPTVLQVLVIQELSKKKNVGTPKSGEEYWVSDWGRE